MERKKASDFPPDVLQLFDRYVHCAITRREFRDRATEYALAPVGGYPGDDEKATALFAKLDANKRTEDLFAAVPFLKSRPECNGNVGAIGFCFGGGVVNQMAVRFADLGAAVPFYGRQPSA